MFLSLSRWRYKIADVPGCVARCEQTLYVQAAYVQLSAMVYHVCQSSNTVVSSVHFYFRKQFFEVFIPSGMIPEVYIKQNNMKQN